MRIDTVFLLAGVFACAACADDPHSSGAPAPQATASQATGAGGARVPITIDYSIMGSAVVGQPVGVTVQVATEFPRPITLRYRVDEVGSITFPESQPQSYELLPLGNAELRSQQLTVVPQREGRVFLVVSAEIENDGGSLMKSMAIPIQVARAPAALEQGEEAGARGAAPTGQGS